MHILPRKVNQNTKKVLWSHSSKIRRNRRKYAQNGYYGRFTGGCYLGPVTGYGVTTGWPISRHRVSITAPVHYIAREEISLPKSSLSPFPFLCCCRFRVVDVHGDEVEFRRQIRD